MNTVLDTGSPRCKITATPDFSAAEVAPRLSYRRAVQVFLVPRVMSFTIPDVISDNYAPARLPVLPAFAPQRDSIERFLGSLYAGAAIELSAYAGLALRDAVVQHLTALGIARLDSVDLDFVALNDLDPAERFASVPPGEGKNFGPGFLLAVLVSGHESYYVWGRSYPFRVDYFWRTDLLGEKVIGSRG